MPVTREGRLNDSLERYQRALPGALTGAGAVVVTRAQRMFVLFDPKGTATGATKRSITVSPPYTSGGYTRVKVGPTTKYSWWLHFGRKPGKMPPVTPEFSRDEGGGNILDWVKEKRLSGSYSIKTKRRLGGRARREREDLDAAWAIAKKIARDGTKPFPFLTVAFRQSKQAALDVFIRMLARGMVTGGR